MYCPSCGAPINEGETRCAICFTAVPRGTAPAERQTAQQNAGYNPQGYAAPQAPVGANIPRGYAQPPHAPQYSAPAGYYAQPAKNDAADKRRRRTVVATVLGSIALALVVVIVTLIFAENAGYITLRRRASVNMDTAILPPETSERTFVPGGPVLDMPKEHASESVGIPEGYFFNFWVGEVSCLANTAGAAINFGEGNYPTLVQAYDGSLAAYTRRSSIQSYSYDLYIMDASGGEKRVDTSVRELVMDATGGIFYVRDTTQDLWHYNPHTDTLEELATRVESFVVSPNGNIVLYRSGSRMFFLEDGKPANNISTSSGEDAEPLAVSDDGRYFVYAENAYNSESLEIYFCVQGQEQPAASIKPEKYSSVKIHQNITGSDMLLEDEMLGLYRFVDGGLQRIGDEVVCTELVLPTQLAKQRNNIAARVSAYNCSDFSGFFYSGKNNEDAETHSLYYYSDGDVLTVMDSGYRYYEHATLQDSGSSLMYISDNDLMLAQAQDGKLSQTMLAEDVDNFMASPDGKHIFYTSYVYTVGSSLFYLPLGGEQELIEPDVSEFYLGGPGGSMCNYLTGETDTFNNIAGEAWLYNAKTGDKKMLGDNAAFISPPDAFGRFFVGVNPQTTYRDRHSYTNELCLYDNGELTSVAQPVKWMNYSSYDYERAWYNCLVKQLN